MAPALPKAPLALCSACPFRDRAMAPSTIPANAKLAVVSRSPGYYETLNGKSFAGPSGKVLDHLLKLHGESRDNVLLTNVVLCQSDGDEPGFGMAVACCNPRLEDEVADVDTIIAAGGEAAEVFTGVKNIAMNRGYVHYRDLELIHGTETLAGRQQRIIVTNNPAMVLRDDATFPELVRDFRLAINPLPPPKMPTVKWIEDIDEAKAAATEMLSIFETKAGSFYDKSEQIVASDIETRGWGNHTGLAHDSKIVCAGFSIRAERAVVFGENPCYDEVFRNDYLRRLYEVEGLRYLWHNGKYDTKILRQNGINARVDEDTLLLSWALDERPGNPESGAGGHSLEWLLKDELGWAKYEPESVKHFKKTGELPDKRSRIELYEYNGYDTAGALGLFTIFEERAKNDDVWDKPYKSMLLRLSEALTTVELTGNLYDDERACNILEAEVWPKLKELLAECQDLSGKPILNLNSSKQLCALIYDEWGLTHNLSRPKIERKGKRSADAKVREEIARGDFVVNPQRVNIERVKIFAEKWDLFKSLDKQRGTYLEGLVLKRFPNGRIYTDFKIHGTESGRLSSSNPNMQNITRPKDGLPNIRSCFIPDSGCSFISGDLSQAELRAIAVLSGDDALKAIYTDTSRSLHKEVAAKFYGKNYSYEQYVRAKNINFGVVYWQSAYTFAQQEHMPQKEAQDYIDFWWATFPQVYEWTKSIEELVLSAGELQSPFGHKRRFYVIPADVSGRQHVVKEGINFKPQNIAANATLWALCNLVEKLDPEIAQVRISVHDSILVNCKNDHVPEIAKLVKAEMEVAVKQAIDWDFPFKADISVGPNYGALEEYVI